VKYAAARGARDRRATCDRRYLDQPARPTAPYVLDRAVEDGAHAKLDGIYLRQRPAESKCCKRQATPHGPRSAVTEKGQLWVSSRRRHKGLASLTHRQVLRPIPYPQRHRELQTFMGKTLAGPLRNGQVRSDSSYLRIRVPYFVSVSSFCFFNPHEMYAPTLSLFLRARSRPYMIGAAIIEPLGDGAS